MLNRLLRAVGGNIIYVSTCINLDAAPAGLKLLRKYYYTRCSLQYVWAVKKIDEEECT